MPDTRILMPSCVFDKRLKEFVARSRISENVGFGRIREQALENLNENECDDVCPEVCQGCGGYFNFKGGRQMCPTCIKL